MDANVLDGLDETTRKEVEALLQVTREKDGDAEYASSRFDIFYKTRKLEGCDLGIDALRNIKVTDEDYELAQRYIIGEYLFVKKDVNLAFEALKKIHDIEQSKEYNFIFLYMAKLYMKDVAIKDFSKAGFVLDLCKKTHSYEISCYRKILDFLEDSDFEKIGSIFLELIRWALEIIEILEINFEQDFKGSKSPERKLAHYTNTSVANILLERKNDNKPSSYFRLNTINNVNDPSEGHLLVGYLEGIKENYFYAPDFDKSLHAFISCFTFNHDSLNQFRLYGKEANKEASGVSLVFSKEFFKESDIQSSMTNISIDKKLKNVSNYLNKEESENKRIERQSVMRCVYIDPTSDYVHLAQRNRLTFFREFGDDILEKSSTSKAELEWNEYKIYIEQKTDSFKEAFAELKKIYMHVIAEKEGLEGIGKEDIDEINSLLDMIVLPLKYLIKHAAFQEEQECRMIYITSLDAPEVKMVDKKFLFVEYEADVKENLDKVYIAPAARDYQMYLAWLLRDKDIKIELSKNPFRLPTSR